MQATPPFRYKRLGYVALNVTDPDRSAKFYAEDVGLRVIARTEDAIALATGENQRLYLVRAGEPGLKRLGFELESADDLREAAAHLTKSRISHQPTPPSEYPDGAMSQGLRLTVPGCGLVMDLYTNENSSVATDDTSIRVQRFGHCVVRAREFDQVYDWLVRHLGFVLSDHIKGETHELVFLRCWPSPYHHSFALARSDHDALHHVSFTVRELDDLGQAQHRLPRTGSRIVFGPGRHVASESVFLYFLDPDGMTLEYLLGMEEFPANDPRAARVLPATLDIADTWGSVPTAEAFSVGTIEGAGKTRRAEGREVNVF